MRSQKMTNCLSRSNAIRELLNLISEGAHWWIMRSSSRSSRVKLASRILAPCVTPDYLIGPFTTLLRSPHTSISLTAWHRVWESSSSKDADVIRIFVSEEAHQEAARDRKHEYCERNRAGYLPVSRARDCKERRQIHSRAGNHHRDGGAGRRAR